MTTAADIIEQYGRVLVHDTNPNDNDYPEINSDMQTLALIVRDWGNAPILDGQAEITRSDLGICVAGQNHWWWNCGEHNCHKGNQ